MNELEAKTILKAQIDCDYKCSHGECLQDCENCQLSYLLGTNESHDNALKLALKVLENESKWKQAIKNIKADIEKEYKLWDGRAQDIIDKHTKELMK